ncbi:MAG: acyltransferase [Myxococcaceae bacterium]|nr:acyltransferase [Myxococcaceae bacterium]
MSPAADRGRFEVLDGWRGLSILFVLASHMLPLGKKDWGLNEASGKVGMALFFCLSGFLIVTQLHRNHNLVAFYIRRLFRILPLAVLVILGVSLFTQPPWQSTLLNLVFVQNYIFSAILPHLEHFWSLCVEVHFYVFIGLLMWLTRFRMFGLLFFVWLCLTVHRAFVAPSGTIETHLRVDELLAGVNLALLNLGYGPQWMRTFLRRVPLLVWLLLLGITCVKWFEPVHPLRGFVACSLVGNTLFREEDDSFPVLRSRALRYIAEVSYAVYVIHPLSMVGWLGTGPTPIIKYLKRPLCFALTFAAAHVSTFYYEHRFIGWGKSFAKRAELRGRAMPAAPVTAASD